jgi:hypothetical protein
MPLGLPRWPSSSRQERATHGTHTLRPTPTSSSRVVSWPHCGEFFPLLQQPSHHTADKAMTTTAVYYAWCYRRGEEDRMFIVPATVYTLGSVQWEVHQ